VRVDLRAVVYIDPDAFVRIARVMRKWREAQRGRVTIEFPERSQPRQASDRAGAGQWMRAPERVRFVLEC
jgi:hypothetical protein